MATKIIILGLLAGLLTGCTPPPPKPIDPATFNGRRAMSHVEALVKMGPRPAGSPTLAKAATYIATQLEEAGLSAHEQVFTSGSPRGPLQFRNVLAKTSRYSGGTGQVIVVASHYDTKYMPDINFVGANDAGSSTGVLLEIARCAASQPDIWFVFFDGEEAIQEYGSTDGLVGSKFFVEDLKSNNQLKWIKAVIVLDMVGDANLKIRIPANTTGSLVQHVFEAARVVGHRDYFELGDGDIHDDHVPFLHAGIPALNLIDFQFGSAPGLNDYWHTDKDTLDKLSVRSLEIVGQTTLSLLARLRAAPAR
ncbi:MAG: hypothetical protein PCFJNLEI_00027 [Verrucomicrobiae bacterium]|nr:hypothetical protein [Verrucomicrobiae bacterium]